MECNASDCMLKETVTVSWSLHTSFFLLLIFKLLRTSVAFHVHSNNVIPELLQVYLGVCDKRIHILHK